MTHPVLFPAARTPRPPRRRSYKNLAKAQETFDQTESLWQTISRWNERMDAWMNEPFSTVDTEEVNAEVHSFAKESLAAHKKVPRDDEAGG